MLLIGTDEPLAVAAVDAIHAGDIEALRRLLTENHGLANAALGGDPDNTGDGGMTRSLLHVATDWPGHFPHAAATVVVLLDAGAEVDARFTGPHNETPLHWAASSDDVEVLDVLLDAGADIEATGGVIGGGTGTPLDDAVAFGQWHAAHRLVERGARTALRHAAALGLLDRIEERFAGPSPDADEITEAFWSACHGGQRNSAQYLLERGADRNWMGYDDLTPLDAADRSGATELVEWLRQEDAKSTTEVR